MDLYYKYEYWDLYDYDGIYIGKIRRGREIPGGLYHASVEVIPTDMQGHILITQRDPSTRKGGGKYEFPAGSVKAGEEPVIAALRELREETGLRALKIYHLQTEKSPYDPKQSGLIRYTYIAHIENLHDAKISLQPGETVDYKIITLEELHKDYIGHGKFDESRLSFYRDDFFERLATAIGEPESKEPKPEVPAAKPVFKLVKSSLRGSAAFDKIGAKQKEVLSE